MIQEKDDYVKNKWNVVDDILYLVMITSEFCTYLQQLLLIIIIVRIVEVGLANRIDINTESSQFADFENLIEIRKQETNVMAVGTPIIST